MMSTPATFDAQVGAVIEVGAKHFAELEATLRGTGGETTATLKELKDLTSAQLNVGHRAATKAAGLRADETLPGEYRDKSITGVLGIAKDLVMKLDPDREAAVRKLDKIVAQGVLPKPHHDDAVRSRASQDLAAALAGKTGTDLAESARKYIGTDPIQDAELLGARGKALFHGAGVGDLHQGLEAHAVATYLRREDGTALQKQMRAALKVIRADEARGNKGTAGHSIANREAALMLIRHQER
jgi:hypothetical protein